MARSGAVVRRPGLIVAGSSGYVGSSLVRLSEGLAPIVCVARTPARIDHRLDFIRFRDLDGAVLPPAVDPARSAIVHLAGCSRESSDGAVMDGNVATTAALIVAARRWGVRRLVYLSGFGIPTESQSVFFRSKRYAERMLEESGLDYVVVRCSYILGGSDEFLPGLRGKAIGGLIDVPGDGLYRLNPTSLYDALAVLFTLSFRRRSVTGCHDFVAASVRYLNLIQDIAVRIDPGMRVVHKPVEDYMRSAMLDQAPAMSLTQVGILVSDLHSATPRPLAGIIPMDYPDLLNTLDYRGSGLRLSGSEWQQHYNIKEVT